MKHKLCRFISALLVLALLLPMGACAVEVEDVSPTSDGSLSPNDDHPDDNEDFVLTISVEEMTSPQGTERIRVNAELKNNSGEDHDIGYTFFFYPRIQGEGERGLIMSRPPLPSFEFFENGSVISRDVYLDWFFWKLSPGVHQLTVEARFFLGWEPTDTDPESVLNPWAVPSGTQQISIISDAIEITVR